MNQVNLRRLADLHAHFRFDNLLQSVLPHTARYCRYGVAMPNLAPPVCTGGQMLHYLEAINAVLASMPERTDFEPLMTIYINDDTTPEMVRHAAKAGAVAGKIYPAGVTTNSATGLRDWGASQFRESLQAMTECGLLLLIHGEKDEERVLVTDREARFMETFYDVVEDNPNLKIVFEHASTKVAIDTVASMNENVAATITAHHLVLTLNDVIGSSIQPHNMCMPVAKGFEDRDALRQAATSGNPKFFLGSDSAPHLREKKECARGACGAYTAPILPELLTHIFEDLGALPKLDDFASRFGPEFYGLPVPTGNLTLVNEEWQVPSEYDGIVPFWAGETLRWKLLT